MEVIKSITKWRQVRKNIESDLNIGFVPTMGCLHQGHASLIRKSVEDNDLTILSIFINPTQFNNDNDFDHYPKTPDSDIKLATDLGVDYILMLEQNELYPDHYLTKVTTEHPLAYIMEGKYRPGHFNGVLSIVLKFLLLVKANRAYFGEKDYQQYKLIESMVESYFIDTEIISCPTVRDNESSLALSSRNSRLNKDQLLLAKQYANIFSQYRQSPDQIIANLTKLGVDIEYVEKYENRLLSAVRIGNIRLIDNLEL